MKAQDRKRLWGKSANRCAQCKCPLTQPGNDAAPEIVVGQEAHIVGKNPGSARYRPLPPDERDAYENRILLCPSHHVIVDGQASAWTEEALVAIKRTHELSMERRTADAEPDELSIDVPGAVETQMLMLGAQVLGIVGPALAYQFGVDDMRADRRETAESLLDELHDFGEMHGLLDRRERRKAATSIGELLLEAAKQHELVLFGALVRCDVTFGRGTDRDRWPVAFVRVRDAAHVAVEQRARASSAAPSPAHTSPGP